MPESKPTQNKQRSDLRKVSPKSRIFFALALILIVVTSISKITNLTGDILDFLKKISPEKNATAYEQAVLKYANCKFSESYQYAQISAAEGDVLGRALVAYLFARGLGVHKDADAAQYNGKLVLEDLRRNAEKRDRDAIRFLALFYREGIAVHRDETKALILIKKAAYQGDAWAQNNLGVAFSDGEGVTADETMAFRWYSESAAQNYEMGKFNLAYSYERGAGTAADPEFAKKIFRHLSCWESPIAWYKAGEAAGEDQISGLYYERSANFKYAPAENLLALRNLEGNREEMHIEAIRLLLDAAQQGFAPAAFNLGLLYDSGIFVEEDDLLALEWYEKAFRLGNGAALTNMAQLLRWSAPTSPVGDVERMFVDAALIDAQPCSLAALTTLIDAGKLVGHEKAGRKALNSGGVQRTGYEGLAPSELRTTGVKRAVDDPKLIWCDAPLAGPQPERIQRLK